MYWAFSSLFWNIQEQNKNQEKDQIQIEQQKEIKKEVTEENNWDIFKYWWKDDLFWHHNWTWLDEKYWFNWISYDQVRDLEDVDEIYVHQLWYTICFNLLKFHQNVQSLNHQVAFQFNQWTNIKRNLFHQLIS